MSFLKYLNPLRTKYRVVLEANRYVVETSSFRTSWKWSWKERFSSLENAKDYIRMKKNPKSNVVHQE